MSTEQKVREIISDKLGIAIEDVKPESDIKKDLGGDSLDVIEVVMEIEKLYNISLDDERIEGFATVKELTDYVTDFTTINKRY